MTQRIGANIPDVPYPPQTMYPLKTWMAGIRWLRDNTKSNDVIIAKVTAGNFIPAYSGNTVFWGQSNTVNYNEKELLVDKFFEGKMTVDEAERFLKNGRVNYVFESFQEREKSLSKPMSFFYPFLTESYKNPDVVIYRVKG
ncbi:hypothetical protein LDC_0001 [sediment metagenome]|uniref:Uncharacterized protein n=1 Tax=sediment metagenome TaxID=749907 RepID=D9PES3_9ZZZZ